MRNVERDLLECDGAKQQKHSKNKQHQRKTHLAGLWTYRLSVGLRDGGKAGEEEREPGEVACHLD